MADVEGHPKIKETEEGDSTITFSPPVYQQRYQAILDLVRELKPKKVADFGCAECKFIQLLRREDVEEICGIDIDEDVLNRAMQYIEPFLTDHLHPRETPLTVRLYKGSVSEFDDVLRGYDMVTMIEVIEHLFPKDLEEFPSIVFQTIKPKTVVITTPNADFNVLFQSNGRFRHWDHKFEWSRIQFAEWCEAICRKYDYCFIILGIGKGPEGTEELGCCSQMAVFTRITQDLVGVKDDSNAQGTLCKYHLIKESIYPQLTKCEIRMRRVAQVLMECIDDIKMIYKDKISNSLLQNLENNNVYIPERNTTTPGQFDDADNDNSCLTEDLSPISYRFFRYPVMSQYLREMHKKYSNCHQKTFLVQGQFDDALPDDYSVHYDNRATYKTYSDPSIKLVNCDIIVPIETLLQFKLLKEFKITEDDLRTYMETNAHLRLSEDEKCVLISCYYDGKDSCSDSYECRSIQDSCESDDNAERISSITDFYEENWDE